MNGVFFCRTSEPYEKFLSHGRLDGSIFRKPLDDFNGFFELCLAHGGESLWGLYRPRWYDSGDCTNSD
jgi:hypothetical protein